MLHFYKIIFITFSKLVLKGRKVQGTALQGNVKSKAHQKTLHAFKLPVFKKP